MEDVIEIPGAIPAIVPDELFWKVQKKMVHNKRQYAAGRYRANVVYLLSGVIWCGGCGKRMIGTSSSYKTRVSQERRKLYYYECNYAKRTKECRNEKINKDKAEEYVLNKLKSDVLNNQAIPKLAQDLYAVYQSEKLESSGEGDYLLQDIARVDKQIANVVEAITIGGASLKVLTDQLKNLETQKATLEYRYQEWLVKQQKDLISLETITDHLNYYRRCLEDLDNPNNVKQAIEKLVDRIIIKPDTIDVFFKVSVVTTGGGGGS
ncbi:zinc ribbon domain-containing protein [Desulfotruncus arcticus]|uniref:zinc ribbon domain-containing protein n=1 Tax=Desulfotruncus arcticus TaxID=341036 RepID=UPI001EE419ED|nr:zinc ribbon domain-containing protein [Desulfotruncus arcticus]